MAIRKCPYCKAIIDEGSEYCSNCGTQLLFPEDENIDEEIPGEKIVEEETPEEGNPKKKKSSSRGRKKKEEEQKVEPAEAVEEAESEQEKEGEGDIELEPIEGVTEEEAEDERDEFFVEKQEPAFETEDLEKVIDPEEKEKVEIEKFLKSLKEDRDEWDGEIPPTDELPPWAEKIKDEKTEEDQIIEEPQDELPKEDEQIIDEASDEEVEEDKPDEEVLPMEEFPPLMNEELTEEKEEVIEPVGLTPEDEVPEVKIPEEETEGEEAAGDEIVEEEIAGEEASEEEETTMPDTGMGLPEGVEQENLPFADKSTEIFKSEEKSPPSKISTWLKSRVFDVLFIAALWIVTLHIASRMLSTNLFKLISVSVFPAVAFYLTLLAVYMFLFFLFLGQTLGDHLFPYEE